MIRVEFSCNINQDGEMLGKRLQNSGGFRETIVCIEANVNLRVFRDVSR
jgi:hypothetical protein